MNSDYTILHKRGILWGNEVLTNDSKAGINQKKNNDVLIVKLLSNSMKQSPFGKCQASDEDTAGFRGTRRLSLLQEPASGPKGLDESTSHPLTFRKLFSFQKEMYFIYALFEYAFPDFNCWNN
jgi:hypothetical protein